MILTILIFIVVLGLLVFVHELGHFVVAKKSGMQVDEFGFGFPPRVAGVQKFGGKWRIVWGAKQAQGEDTVYSINLIPLGGFVKILGENNDQVGNPKAFTSKPFFPRLATLLAGVVMNVVLAWVLVSIGLMVGLPAVYDNTSEIPYGGSIRDLKVTIVEVKADSPAQKSGLRVGDSITNISGASIGSVDQLQEIVAESEGKPLAFQISRAGGELSVNVSPEFRVPENRYLTGIVISLVGNLSYPWYKAPLVGLANTATSFQNILVGLGSVFSGKVGFDQLGGPAKIAQLTGEASKLGIPYLLQFTAFLSLNLAILNSLPFPALDGGRVLFLLVEKVRRKPNNQQFEQAVNAIGFLLLLILMFAVTVNDIRGFGGLGAVLGKLF